MIGDACNLDNSNSATQTTTRATDAHLAIF